MLGLPLPWWAKYAAIAALVAAACGATYVQTADYYEDQMELQRLRVEKAGAEQNARTALQIEQQRRITEGVVHGWDKAVKDLRERYAVRAPVGVRNAASAGRGLVPPVSHSAGTVDEPTADDRLADCAETTLMLKTLQDWIRQVVTVTTPRSEP